MLRNLTSRFLTLTTPLVLSICLTSEVKAQTSNNQVAIPSALLSIQGIGEAWPDAKNISKDPNFHLYQWSLSGVPLFQLNRKDGTVVAVFAVDQTGAVAFPIGEASDRVGSGQGFATATSEALVAAVTGAAPQQVVPAQGSQCPCTSTAVHDDGSNIVVAVLDKNATVLAVYALLKKIPIK